MQHIKLSKYISESTLINRLKPELNAQLPCTSRTFQQFPEQVAPPMTPQMKLKVSFTSNNLDCVVMHVSPIEQGNYRRKRNSSNGDTSCVFR